MSLAIGLAWVLGGSWAAIGVFVVLLVGFAAAAYALRGSAETDADSPRLARLLVSRESSDGRRRILVLANETLVGEALHAEIEHRLAGQPGQVFVTAPALTSRLRHWTSDIDGASREAQARLARSLAALEARRIDASGSIGDDEPLQALEDALREFPADEVIISTHPPQRSHWLETNLVAEARARFPLPITHVVVDLEHEQAHIESTAGETHAAAGAERRIATTAARK